ncbi:MAG: tRNA (guanosine(37)-N1)-methyltransferase TrmD, partial [Caulobacteraceae bacterium]|nr:tRNA (guanosine(37)-N1)-methyltransferase TrmD [Caulobacteraceae bacterium]
PRTFEGIDIPEILLSGDHRRMAAWRHEQREETTRERRPDLWAAHLATRPAEPSAKSKLKGTKARGE